jgi:hypothetical protein
MTDNVIKIDGKEYNTEDMSIQQKYIIVQIRHLQNKSASLRSELDQVERAKSSFTNSLIESMNIKEKKAS